MNMKKKLFYVALAITALASCSSNDFVGDESPQTSNGTNGAISFNMSTQAITRGSSTDATKLNKQFIVWGEKNEDQSAAGTAPATGNLVFPNYLVNYGVSTAYTTTSNTNDWEYVGFKFDDGSATIPTTSYSTNITPNTKPASGDAPAQTIKYWDNDANSYTFTAISAKPADIAAGLVKITKNPTGTDVYQKGYTVTLAKDGSNYSSLADVYFADRINIAKGSGYSHNAVQFTFRNVLSHVRVGMYETIPGYEVSEIKFYEDDGSTEYKKETVSAFGAVCPNVSATNFEGSITVTYYDATKAEIQNHPKLSVAPSSGVGNGDLVLGTNFSTLTVGTTEPAVAAKFLGTTASAPTYDTDGGAYTAVLSQIANTTPLKLKVNYKLYNTVTKEIIQVTGKTAVIPAEYLQWKANFKYTYLFKITDEELNPITFDAVVVESENGEAEYITTVSAPSITTFGVKSNVYSKEKAEYETGTDIYATFVKGTAVQTPSLTEGSKANYVQIYQVTTSDATNFPITEASVAERLAETPAGSAMITCTNVTTSSNGTYFTNEQSPSVVSSVPSEDGGTKTIAAVILPGAKTNTYAIEYITYDAGTALTTEQSKVGYYSKSGDVYTLQESGNGDNSTLYYKRVKTYKVIKVVATPAP